MKKFEHGALAHLRVGDSVIFPEKHFLGGKVTRIVDGPHTADSYACFICNKQRIAAGCLYHPHVMVVPSLVCAELRALIQAQPKGVSRTLAVVRVFSNTEYPMFTLANITTGARLHSRITSVERADLTFETEPRSGAWYEGRPSVEECHTEYCIGDHILVTPATFDPVLYT